MDFIPGLLVAVSLAAPASRNEDAAVEFFEKKVRPILVGNCSNCHSADTNSKGGLRVDDRNGLVKGGNRGPAIVPGAPEKSLLIRAVRQTGPLKMPRGKKLTAEQVAILTKWVKDGAVWPRVKVPLTLGKPRVRHERLRKTHWAWQPLRQAKVPAVRAGSWPRGDIDRFVLAALEAGKLKPVSDADRATLIRRVTFDLTGLPPTPAAIDSFVEDRAPGAYEKVVDRLLASAGFGERWGRHWLDVARYGESTGSSRNLPMPHAWRYRDYVLAAVNADKPYDRFIKEQIAGDLLPFATAEQRREQLIATGFLALGVKDVNQRFKVRFVMDNIDEQIDTVTRSVLGLTASCARCHDHKFDPISQMEYYALAGIFQSTDLMAGLRNKMGGGGLDYYDTTKLLRLGVAAKPDAATTAKIARAKKLAAAAKKEFEAIRGTPEGKALAKNGRPKQQMARQKMVRLQNELKALTEAATMGEVAFGARDAAEVGDTEVRVRGEAELLGPVARRGFLSVPVVPDAPKVNARQSGRLELAQWLTSPKNPLTARVIVNRVWHHLFGAGLVRSVDNFGLTGDKPSHPDLLDHLAARFIAEGWSVKQLVRDIVLSRAYQLGTDAPKANTAVDPGNRLVWRHSPRRLSAEEMRDAILATAGTLSRARPVGSAAKDLKVIEVRNNGPEAKKIAEAANRSRGRSVYLPLVRGLVPASLEVFDPAEQGMVSGARDATTVAPQALYLLNDPFVRSQAAALAKRLSGSDAERIKTAYRLALGRPAAAPEVKRALAYLADEGEDKADALASFCQALFACAEFRYLR